jgi:DNA circularisation protein N-terminus
MSYWEDNLQQASLEYVEFPVQGRTLGTGRRKASTQLPYRSGQLVEDFGRKVFTWSLTVPLYRGMDWPTDTLYPDVYLRLLALVTDESVRGEVTYIDPEFGPFQVSIVDYDISTPADRQDGVLMTLRLEERGLDQDLLANLSPSKQGGATRALLAAEQVDQEVAYDPAPQEEKPSVSLGDAWKSFQAALDQGALAADEIAALLDDLYFTAEKFINFSAKEELERWSLFQSVVRFLGAAEDAADASASDQGSLSALIEAVLPADMSAFDIATYYHDDAQRADEVVFNNPSSNPLSYPRGSVVRVASDAATPDQRATGSAR